MYTNKENKSIQKYFPWVAISLIIFLIFKSSPNDWYSSFFLDHDYPFDYYSWKDYYYFDSNSRLSTIGIATQLPNYLISILFNDFPIFIKTFVIKIIPIFLIFFMIYKKLINDYSYSIKNFKDYYFIYLIVVLIFFGLTGQMFFSAGIFYNYIFQLNIFIFLIHLLNFYKDEFSICNNKNIFLSALLLQVSIINGSFFIPISLYLFIIYFDNLKKIINKSNLITLSLIIISAIFFYYLYSFHYTNIFNLIDTSNAKVVNKGYENLKGGYLYQFIGYSNWGIYTGWNGRIIGGFIDFYDNLLYISSLFILNLIGLTYLIKNKKYKLITILITFIILSSGNQLFFGNFYVWLVDNMPGFTSLRTPDNKFGLLTQSILIIAVIKEWFCNNKKKQVLIIIALTIVSIINLYPIYEGRVIFGNKSIFQNNSTFILNINYEKKLLSLIDTNDYVLIVPGHGTFEHPSGKVGIIDPIYTLHEKVISSEVIQNDKTSLYYESLTQLDFKKLLEKINVIVLRKPYLDFYSHTILYSNGYSLIHSDNYSKVYKSSTIPGKKWFEFKYLYQIIAITIFLYFILFYLLIRYFRSK